MVVAHRCALTQMEVSSVHAMQVMRLVVMESAALVIVVILTATATQLVDLTFLEINECLSNNGFCSQVCINTDGSFTCSCNVGYKLGGDGKSCGGKFSNFNCFCKTTEVSKYY